MNPAAPRALHVVAAEADAARGEVLRAEVVVHRKLLRTIRPCIFMVCLSYILELRGIGLSE